MYDVGTIVLNKIQMYNYYRLYRHRYCKKTIFFFYIHFFHLLSGIVVRNNYCTANEKYSLI